MTIKPTTPMATNATIPVCSSCNDLGCSKVLLCFSVKVVYFGPPVDTAIIGCCVTGFCGSWWPCVVSGLGVGVVAGFLVVGTVIPAAKKKNIMK